MRRGRVPIRRSEPATSRASQSFPGVGGMIVSASSTTRRMNSSGRVPKASSARRAEPNRLVTRGERRAGDVGEQQRRAARRDHPPVNLRRLQDRIDRRVDYREVAVTPELLDERAQVREPAGCNRHHSGSANAQNPRPDAMATYCRPPTS